MELKELELRIETLECQMFNILLSINRVKETASRIEALLNPKPSLWARFKQTEFAFILLVIYGVMSLGAAVCGLANNQESCAFNTPSKVLFPTYSATCFFTRSYNEKDIIH